MHSHTAEGLMQLVSEFGQCRWSEGTYGASFIAKGQERGQREEAAKLYEEIRSYATALCQQGEPTDEHRQLMKFYRVDSLVALVDAQAYHIEKLQAKLPPLPSLAPQRVREG